MSTSGRIDREKKTIETMIGMYCHDRHETGEALCEPCRELLEYARKRLALCPFQDDKPTCAKCTVHCYQPAMREKVRAVMRHSGPRMTYRHPIMALHHFKDGRHKSKGAQK